MDAEVGGGDFDADAQAVGVGAIADEAQFELAVGVAAVVAPGAQARALLGQHQVGVAVAVEVRQGRVGDAGERPGVEFGAGGDVLEAAVAQVAPELDTPAQGQQVQPAVVVVVHQPQRRQLGQCDGQAVEAVDAAQEQVQVVVPAHQQVGA